MTHLRFGVAKSSPSGRRAANLAGLIPAAKDEIPAIARKITQQSSGAVLALDQAMSFYSTEYHTMMMSPGKPGAASAAAASVTVAPAATDTTAAASGAPAHESFFHHLLDVVNPLQHLPIIGTIYRAITGEHLDPVEKIAGDTLYGGLWGAVSSIADVAFESITGKSFEDTALALFKGDGSPKVASTKVVAPAIVASNSLPSADLPGLPSSENVVAANTGLPPGFDTTAFTNALAAKGVDSDTASRALYAYRRSMGLTVPPPVLAGAY